MTPPMKSIRLAGALALSFCALQACEPASSTSTDITGVMPRLEFSMVRANDGAPVSAENYRGKTVLLYFGYTHCPDECPTTLTDLSDMLRRIGPDAKNARVLFVTVDPARDTVPVMRAYVHAFGPDIDGLRGDANAIAALARRYRVLYETTPASQNRPYAVMHSDSVFVFDGQGRARLVLTSTRNAAQLAAMVDALS